jgi:hypothetical protein
MRPPSLPQDLQLLELQELVLEGLVEPVLAALELGQALEGLGQGLVLGELELGLVQELGEAQVLDLELALVPVQALELVLGQVPVQALGQVLVQEALGLALELVQELQLGLEVWQPCLVGKILDYLWDLTWVL